MDVRPIGLFDSGVGGLTIWRALRRLLPDESLIYLADTAYFPYGVRSTEQLRARAERVVAALLGLRCKLIVVACNTATVATLAHLRLTFPRVPFVGVVPVVKVLAEQTRTGTLALLATPGTASSAYLADLVTRFAGGLAVVTVGCAGLAEAIEQEGVDSLHTRTLLARYLEPVRASAADVLGLGCTHYPFLRPAIAELLGDAVRVYDSAEPVARRVAAVLGECDAPAGARPSAHRFLCTAATARFAARARMLMHDGLIEPELQVLPSCP